MSTPETLNERDLHALVDGALDAEDAAAARDWLSSHPDDAAKAAVYAAQNQALHAAFDPVMREDVPARLHDVAEGRADRRLARGAVLRRLAAAIALLLFGAAAGWLAHGFVAGSRAAYQDLAVESLSAHRVYVVEVRHPVEVAADQEQHLVTWLTKRIGATVRAPDLSGLGYRLVGGRLLPAQGRPAAQLMYEATDGGRVTVYLRANTSDTLTSFRFDRSDDLSAFYWLDKDLAYAIVAELPREKLFVVADAIYAQLDEGHAPTGSK